MFDVLLQVLLGDVGAGKSSLVLSFVKEQFVEFQFKFKQPQLGFHNINNPSVDLYFHCAKDAMSTVEFHKTLMNQVFPLAGRTIL
ncbi:hypothetical protein COP2_037251 [Malus domestica]